MQDVWLISKEKLDKLKKSQKFDQTKRKAKPRSSSSETATNLIGVISGDYGFAANDATINNGSSSGDVVDYLYRSNLFLPGPQFNIRDYDEPMECIVDKVNLSYTPAIRYNTDTGEIAPESDEVFDPSHIDEYGDYYDFFYDINFDLFENVATYKILTCLYGSRCHRILRWAEYIGDGVYRSYIKSNIKLPGYNILKVVANGNTYFLSGTYGGDSYISNNSYTWYLDFIGKNPDYYTDGTAALYFDASTYKMLFVKDESQNPIENVEENGDQLFGWFEKTLAIESYDYTLAGSYTGKGLNSGSSAIVELATGLEADHLWTIPNSNNTPTIATTWTGVMSEDENYALDVGVVRYTADGNYPFDSLILGVVDEAFITASIPDVYYFGGSYRAIYGDFYNQEKTTTLSGWVIYPYYDIEIDFENVFDLVDPIKYPSEDYNNTIYICIGTKRLLEYCTFTKYSNGSNDYDENYTPKKSFYNYYTTYRPVYFAIKNRWL